MNKLFVVVLLALAGCGTITDRTADSASRKYQGKPISLVFQRWGVPDRSVPADGGTIYQWRVSDSSGTCRIEAHGADSLTGQGPQTYIGGRFVGDDATCAAWAQMLK